MSDNGEHKTEMKGMDVDTILGNKSLILTKIEKVVFGSDCVLVVGTVKDYDGVKREFALIVNHKVLLTNFEVASCTTKIKKK